MNSRTSNPLRKSLSRAAPLANFRHLALLLSSAFVAFFSLSCTPLILVTPYDEVTDTRLEDFKESLNIVVKRAASRTGTATGTFEAFQEDYAGLEVKIDSLIDRAKLQPQGVGCKIDDDTWKRIKTEFVRASGLPANNASAGEPAGCIVLMLNNVKQNLTDVETSHKNPALCASTDKTIPTCLRAASAQGLLAVSNQTIDAVLLVEQTMKSHQEAKK